MIRYTRAAALSAAILAASGVVAVPDDASADEHPAASHDHGSPPESGRSLPSQQPSMPAGHPETPEPGGRLPGSHPQRPAQHPQMPQTPGIHPQVPGNVVNFDVGQSNVKALLVDGRETWIGTSGGAIRYDPVRDKYIRYDNKSGLLSNGVFYLGKIGGEIWVGTYGGGLSVFSPQTEQWRNYNVPDGMADAFVYDVVETRSGDIWIATWSGANRVVGGQMDDISKWQLYTVENTDGGLPNDWVYGLAEGKDGEVWLATEGGLARFADGQWQNWTHAEGLGAPYEQVEGAMPFRSDPGQVSSHHARQKVEQGLQEIEVAYNPNYIVSLEVDPDGRVWAGTWGGGLSRFDGQGWRTYTVADGLPGNHIFSLSTDQNGALWIGTSRGLARSDGDRFVTYGRADGIRADAIFSIEFADDGAAWIGGLGGITWFPEGPTPKQAGG